MNFNTLVALCLLISLVVGGSARASQTKPANHITIMGPEDGAIQLSPAKKIVKKLHASTAGRYAGNFSLNKGVECAFPFKVNFPGAVKAMASWKGAKYLHVQIVPYPYHNVTWKKFRSYKKVSRGFGLEDLGSKKNYCLLIKNTSTSGIAYGKVMVDTPNLRSDVQDVAVDKQFEKWEQKKRPNHILAKFSISPGAGGSRVIKFKNKLHGIIRVDGQWTGLPKVTFVLDAPGGKNASQVGKTDKSPLVMRYKVKPKDLKGGDKWRLTIKVPKAKGSARGIVRIILPTAGK